MGDIDVVLGRARLLGERTVGDELRVDEQQGISPEPGGEDVGLGLGDLHHLGPQVEIGLQEPADRLIQGQATGRPVRLAPRGSCELAVERQLGIGEPRHRPDSGAGWGTEGLGGRVMPCGMRGNPGPGPVPMTP